MAAVRRIRYELRNIADGKIGESTLALMPLDPNNLMSLRGIILAPPGSPMEGYILMLDVEIPAEYPFKAPKFSFKNKVWNPKVNEHGSVSLGHIEGWKPSTSLETLLISIQFMLREPEEAADLEMINTKAWKQYVSDRPTYIKTSKSYTEMDNEGFGIVALSDYQIMAIQSLLKVQLGIKHKAYVFCSKENEFTWKLAVVVVPNVTSYRQQAEQQFKQYLKLTTLHFDFEEDEVALNFGDGITRDKCWNITALCTPKFKKENTGRDPRSNSPAVCELTMKWVRGEIKPQRVIHKFEFTSSDKSLYTFDVCLDPDYFLKSCTHNTVQTEEQPTLFKLLKFPLKKPSFDGKNHMDILERIGTKYWKFGVLLLEDVTGSKITSIVSQMSGDPESINHEIVRRWLNGEGKCPITWKTFMEVLEDIQMSSIVSVLDVPKCV